VEAQGNHCLFLQGFCGDVDPFRNKVRWGAGTERDIDAYGAHLAARLFASDAGAQPIPELLVGAAEERVSVPVEPLDPERVESLVNRMRHAFRTAEPEKVERFVAEWRAEAELALPALRKRPYLDGVPVQVLALGPVSLAALPGEVFCELGLKLRARAPGLYPLGYSNGNIGYIPTASAYERSEDYACTYAPRFYGVAAFEPGIESVIVEAARRVVGRAGAGTKAHG
jgi:hypothetical protein